LDTIFRGELTSRGGRALAWADSLLVDHAVFRLVWSNWATVVPGRLYRCNHPTPGRLAALARRYRLRTVVNLRGACGNGSDALSREAAARLGLAFIDAPLGSRVPQRDRILKLCDSFDRMPEPALIHCKSGADRAGLAAGVFILLNGGRAEQALGQLALRFGHFSRSRAGIIDAFFRRFAEDAEGRKPFRDWLHDDYDDAALRRGFVASGIASFVNDRLLARE
jgi:protein tyrosine/serine phosphatase